MKNLLKTCSPHIADKMTGSSIKYLFLASLLPVVIASIVFFGMPALIILITSTISAILTEIIITKFLQKQNKLSIRPGTIITGLLLGLIMPSTSPLWAVAIGSVFAISIGKYAFGVGNNIFNPALVGRAFLVAAWPSIMTAYAIDAVTSATPLTAAKIGGYDSVISAYGSKLAVYKGVFIGNISGVIGETSALAILISAVFLLALKIIDWRIVFSYLGGVLIIAAAFGHDPIFHILSGGVLFGAVFMATDYMSTPMTRSGKYIFGAGCAIVTMIIRLFAGAPEGVTFAILLMNAFTPLIDRFTIPRPFGWRKR